MHALTEIEGEIIELATYDHELNLHWAIQDCSNNAECGMEE